SISEISLESAGLGVEKIGSAAPGRRLRGPVRRATAGYRRRDVRADAVRCGGPEQQCERLGEERVITDLITATPNSLALPKDLAEPARLEPRRPAKAKGRPEILIVRVHVIRDQEFCRIESRKRRIA